jgi:hypothetical protein
MPLRDLDFTTVRIYPRIGMQRQSRVFYVYFLHQGIPTLEETEDAHDYTESQRRTTELKP